MIEPRENIFPPDGGPVYAETVLGHFPAEPWNTVTIIPFLLIALYWGFKIHRSWREQRVLALSVPLLLIGTFGGGMYHAYRSRELWLQLDYAPIALLAALGACVFWRTLWLKNRKAFTLSTLAVIAMFLLSLSLRDHISRQLAISVAYIHMSVLVLLPAYVLVLSKTWGTTSSLLLATMSFAVAIVFRIIDFNEGIQQVFPMGTHFLWHLFGASCTFFMLRFIYRNHEVLN